MFYSKAQYTLAKKQVYTITSKEQMIQNLLKLYHLGIANNFGDVNWYVDANKKISQISQQCNIPVYIVAFVTSAISPNNNWELNIKQAENLIKYYLHNNYIDSAKTHESNLAGTYFKNRYKAVTALLYWKNGINIPQEILYEFLSVKTYNFAYNLLSPYDNRFVTIDGHAINACLYGTNYRPLSKVVLKVGNKGLSRARYDVIKEIYYLTSEILDISANVLQSVVWSMWRTLEQ